MLIGGGVTASAQIRATTEYGDRVILYPDGTWRYIGQYDDGINNGYGWGDDQVNIDAGASGKRFAVVLDDHQLFFVIDNGQLEDIYIYDRRGGLVYTYREGIKRVPYNWTIQYDTGFEQRLRKLGPYTFEYNWHSGKLERLGEYEIEYRFHDDRVEQIGNYSIDYDFRTGRVSEVGNIRIEYEFMTNGIRGISGREPSLQLYLLSDRRR